MSEWLTVLVCPEQGAQFENQDNSQKIRASGLLSLVTGGYCSLSQPTRFQAPGLPLVRRKGRVWIPHLFSESNLSNPITTPTGESKLMVASDQMTISLNHAGQAPADFSLKGHFPVCGSQGLCHNYSARSLWWEAAVDNRKMKGVRCVPIRVERWAGFGPWRVCQTLM